jgi:antirestriction protein ArdC
MADGSLYAPLNYNTRRNYTGVNRMLLTAIARAEGYESGEWATYKAIAEAGGQVRKGEKGTGIVYWNRSFKVTETGKWYPNERAVIKAGFKLPQDLTNKKLTEAWSLISHTVFNIQQADGLESKATGEVQNPEHTAIPQADDIYNNYPKKPSLAHGGDSAHYVPSRDHVQMPKPEAFVDTASYYKTLFHELVHSTGHKDRLNRDTLTKVNAWGDELYSREELVAEIGAWYLTGLCGLEPKDSELNSQAYINGWIKNLEDKEREAVYAIGQATKAVEHILEGKGATAPKTPKKVKKEPVLASKQVKISNTVIAKLDKETDLGDTDHTVIQQCKEDIKTVDYCLNHFNLDENAKQQLLSVRGEALQDLLYTKNQDDKLQKLVVKTESGDSKNEAPLQKYLENIYQKTAVKLLDFTVWDALQYEVIAIAEVDECEYYYIYKTTFAGEPAVGYVNKYRNEFKLHSKQVTVKQVANAVKETSNYFDKGSMAFFNQTLSDFTIESIGGGKYFLYAPSYWDGELMGFSCIIYDSNENILESVNVDDSEKSSPEAIAELIERLRAENAEHKVYSKQVTIKNDEVYKLKKELQIHRILGEINDRILEIQTLKGGWIMTNKVLRTVLQEHEEVQQEWDRLHRRKDFVRKMLWKF